MQKYLTPFCKDEFVMLREGENLLLLKTRQELRDWLTANGTTEKSCWIIISRKPKPDTILYLDAVEEVLCFGWRRHE